jgi:polysaccharide biosynthesis protein PslH
MLHFKAWVRPWLWYCLKCAGKGEKKVASVFGVNAAASHDAVLYLRRGAPDVPVWLFTTVTPLPETAVLCERVYLNKRSLMLVAGSERHLWRCSVAISVGTWTGSGAWPLKLAPFLIPPFRVLILNGNGGFFSGSPANVIVHGARAGSDAVQRAWGRTRELIHSVREAIHNARVHGQEGLDRVRIRVKGKVHTARVRANDLSHGLAVLSAATGLRVAATLLRWMSNPHLTLVERWHGNQPLVLDVEASKGDGLIHFTQSGPQWDGAELEKAALSSDARWLLWRSGRDADPVTDGMGLFDDARTFAISRQTHCRGWKKVVLPTAPFRTLQAGEATRVSAPLSEAILVDRRKLLALGIPRCSMPGAAWLILFWKAAAAGWRSYSIGQGAPLSRSLPEQPEFPIQDTAFVLQTLPTPALRRLSPRQQELSRGNICFRTADFKAAAPRESERLKVLVVSPFLPYPLAHGGAVRIYNLCRELSDRVDFTLVAMREANDVVDYDKLHQVFREVYIVDKDQRNSVDLTQPAQVSSSESSSLRALIAQLSHRLLPDVLQIEYTHFAAFRDSAPGVPALLVEHDLTFSLYRQLAETNSNPTSWGEYERWLAFERKWLASYEGVWTVSEDDRLRAIAESRRDPDRTFRIANGVDLERFQPCVPPEGTREIFYVGSFRHLPNIIGFERLCEEIMPRVWAKAPDTRLCVVAGPEHERFWKHFAREKDLRTLDPRIVVHGFVEDLRPLYERAWVVAVPLEVSAGTNIKVLEAMACGKAIVSTPVGCAGLDLQDGYEIAIRRDWEEFSDTLCTLLSDNALRSDLGSRARWSAETYFSWTAIAERAYESYITVAGKPSDSRSMADRSMTAV